MTVLEPERDWAAEAVEKVDEVVDAADDCGCGDDDDPPPPFLPWVATLNLNNNDGLYLYSTADARTGPIVGVYVSLETRLVFFCGI